VLKDLKPALALLVVLSVLTGFAYPLAVTGFASLVFPHRAGGSLIVRDGRIVGSELLGQPFSSQGWFWSRPSSTSPPYDSGASAGSNLGPMNPSLSQRMTADVARLRASGGIGGIPVDLVTASGSGLDPDISPAAALYQAPRVARERGLPPERVLALVRGQIEGRQLGFLGEPRVNVVRLNLALDALARGEPSRR
jgi:K+-transporting ATPase ATPase C chain